MRWTDRLIATPRLQAAALFGGVLVVYLVTTSWDYPLHIDTQAASYPAWWFSQYGTLDLTGWATPNPWIVETAAGLRSNRLPGALIIDIPAYVLVGGGTFSPAPSAATAAVVAASAVAIMFLAMRPLVGARVGALGALVLAFCTGTWTVSADMSWAHGPAQLGIALGLYGASRGRYAWGGLGFAWAILTRPHTAVIAACVGVAASLEARRWRPALAMGATSFLGVVGLTAYHRITLDQWSLLGSYSANADSALAPSADAWLNDVAGLFVSPERGVLIYSTFLILLLPGVPRAWHVVPAWVRGAAIGGVLYMGLQLAGNVVDGGSGYYSYRYALEALTACTPLLTVAAQQWTLRDGPRRWLFFAFVALSLGLHSLGAYVYGSDGFLPQLWNRFAPIDTWGRASGSQIVAISATALVIGAAMAWIWRAGRTTGLSAREEEQSDGRPDDPTTTPAAPTPDHAAPSPATPAGH